MALIRQLAWMSRMIYFAGQHTASGWVRVSDTESFSGFFAAEFQRRSGPYVDVVVCFRGTEFYDADYKGGTISPGSLASFAADAVSDLGLISDSSAQVESAREYAATIVARTARVSRARRVILTGHSLGASLAQAAVVVCPKDTRVITFCTPLVNFQALLQAKLTGYKNVLNITVKGDPVTRFAGLGGRLSIGRVIELNVPYGQPGLDKHSMHDLAEYLSKDALGRVDVSADTFDPSRL